MSDTIHYLLVNYQGELRYNTTEMINVIENNDGDLIVDTSNNIAAVLKLKAKWDLQKNIKTKLVYINKYPFLVIKKDTMWYKNKDNKINTYIKCSAIGKLNIDLFTNQINDSIVDEYFENILRNAELEFNPKIIPFDSLTREFKKAKNFIQ
ncbi:MAG: hypothetical protein ABL940_11505 [Bacteroidia bacterium]